MITTNINMLKNNITNILILSILVMILFVTTVGVLHSIDNITARDCVRGIRSACVACQATCNESTYQNMLTNISVSLSKPTHNN